MRSILRTVVLIILFFLCGFLIGKVLLTYSLNDFLTGKNKYALFVSRPMYNFLNLYNNLNSTNEYNRLRA